MYNIKAKIKINETVSANGFRHPGIGCSAETLTVMRDGVLSDKHPWSEYYAGLCKVASDEARLISRIRNNNDINNFRRDAETAWSHAVMYIVTGDTDYRRLPCEIIRWYGAVKDFFPEYFSDSHIKLGKYVYTICAAAEILRYTEPFTGELAVTGDMIRALGEAAIRPIHEKSLHKNSYFMNQHTYAIIGSLAYTIMTDDIDGYNEIVEWTTVNATAENPGRNGSIAGVIRRVTRNDATGEETEPNIQLVEMGRDQPHAAGNIDNLLMMTRTMEIQHTMVDRVKGRVTCDGSGISPLRFCDDRLLTGHYLYIRHNIGLPLKWIPTYAESGNAEIKIVYDEIAPHGYGSFSINGIAAAYYYYRGKGYDESDERYRYISTVYKSFYSRFYNSAVSGEFIANLHNYAFDFFTGLSAGSADNNDSADNHGSYDTARTMSEFEHITLDLSALDHTDTVYQPVIKRDGCIRLLPARTPRKTAICTSLPAGTVTVLLRSNAVSTLIFTINRGMDSPEIHKIYTADTNGEWMFVRFDTDTGINGILDLSVSSDADEAYVDLKYIMHYDAPDAASCNFPESDTAAPTDTISVPNLINECPPDITYITYIGQRLCYDIRVDSITPVIYGLYNPPQGVDVSEVGGELSLNPILSGNFDFYLTAKTDSAMLVRRIELVVADNADEAMKYALSPFDPTLEYEPQSYKLLDEAIKKNPDDMNSLRRAAASMKLLSPRHGDGSLDYRDICVSSIPAAVGIYSDDNRYTFYSIWDECRSITFDFGEEFRVVPRAFGIRARVSFPKRVNNTSFYGSYDNENWILLTDAAVVSDAMQILDIKPQYKDSAFRYIKAYRAPDNDVPILDIDELKIFGDRIVYLSD